MVNVITATELASYLSVDVTPALTLVVELTNGVITEAWDEDNVVDPVPARVRALAFDVAARAAANPKNLTSWTLSWDDINRTERVEGQSRRFGVYLTDEEIAVLNGDPGTPGSVGTIHTPPAGQGPWWTR